MTVRELNEVEMAKKAYSGLLNKPNRALEQRFRRWRELSAAGIDAAVTLEDAWNAHKVRNAIAHQGSDFVLTKRVADATITQYRHVFEEFKFV